MIDAATIARALAAIRRGATLAAEAEARAKEAKRGGARAPDDEVRVDIGDSFLTP